MTTDQSNPTKLITNGFEQISKSTVIICGIARDCAPQLSNLIPMLENLANKFKQYKIIAVENDSEDNTAEVIRSWAANNHDVIPLLFSRLTRGIDKKNPESNDSDNFDFSRISNIAFARNVYLRELLKHQSADFVIIVDLDIMDFSISGIAHSFGLLSQWDCATSSGLRYTLRTPFTRNVYWDTYAYEPMGGFTDGVQKVADIRSRQKEIRKLIDTGSLIPALSAFGGLAVYKYQLLLNQKYELLTNSDPEVPVLCEHVALNRSIDRANKGFRLVINPHQKVQYESPATTISRNLHDFLYK